MKKKIKFKERCSHDDCRRRAKAKHECVTCEKLASEERFFLFSCAYHHEPVKARVKRHALVAHPVNILRATGAALKGEDVF